MKERTIWRIRDRVECLLVVGHACIGRGDWVVDWGHWIGRWGRFFSFGLSIVGKEVIIAFGFCGYCFGIIILELEIILSEGLHSNILAIIFKMFDSLFLNSFYHLEDELFALNKLFFCEGRIVEVGY